MRAGPAFSYLAGVLLLCVMNILLKQALHVYPVVMANAWRYLFAALATALLWWTAGRPPIARAILPAHLLRGAVIAVSAVSFFFAVTRLTLAESITLSFVSPLLVPPLARILLQEQLQARALAAGALGFLGVLVAASAPSDAMTTARLEGAAAILVSALSYALATVILRARAEQDGTPVVSLLGTLVPTAFLFPAAALAGNPLVPEPAHLLLLVAAGVASALALWLFARALSVAEAQTMVPFDFSALVWMSLFGFLFFGEAPGWRTILGAAIIISAIVLAGRPAVPPLPR